MYESHGVCVCDRERESSYTTMGADWGSKINMLGSVHRTAMLHGLTYVRTYTYSIGDARKERDLKT